MSEYLTLKEAAERLHYTERHVRQMCIDGKITGAHKVGVGRKWLIPEEALEEIGVKEAIAQSYQAGLMKVSPSSIYNIIKESKAEKLLDNPRLRKHLEQLAQTAEVLAHHVQRLLRYKDEEVEVLGNIVEGLGFFRKNADLDSERVEPLEEYEYEKQHPVDSYLADCLFVHYENKFGNLTFKSWNELGEAGKENATQDLFKNLFRLSHSELIRFCPACPSCQAIVSSKPSS